MGCYITQIVKPVSKWLGAAMVFLLVNTETGLAENGTGIGLGFRAMQKIWHFAEHELFQNLF